METLERIERETAKSYRAFCDYARMGGTRSLSKLQRLYKSSTEDTPTTSLRTLKEWSTVHDWQARCADYDQQRESEVERAVRARKLRMLDAFGELVTQAIAEADASGASLSQVAGAVRTYLDSAMAIADEMPTHRLEVKNTTEMSEDELRAEAERLVRRMRDESQISHVLDVPTDAEGKGD